MWPDPQALRSFLGNNFATVINVLSSILALSTSSSTILLSPHYFSVLLSTHEQLEWQWHLWACPDTNRVRPSGPSFSKLPSLSGDFQLCCRPPPPQKVPNIPTINKSDWLNCRHTQWIVHTSQSSTTDCFWILCVGVALLDGGIAPYASESKLPEIDLFSSPHIPLCAVYTVEVLLTMLIVVVALNPGEWVICL